MSKISLVLSRDHVTSEMHRLSRNDTTVSEKTFQCNSFIDFHRLSEGIRAANPLILRLCRGGLATHLRLLDCRCHNPRVANATVEPTNIHGPPKILRFLMASPP